MTTEQYITPDTHYTCPEMVSHLLHWLNLPIEASVLDPCSGRNLVWFNAFKQAHKYEIELERGQNFYDFTNPIDWIVGNPPFKESGHFLEHALTVATKGVAFLLGETALRSTLDRLDRIDAAGFAVTRLHVVRDARWRGIYCFIVCEKSDGAIISWTKRPFGRGILKAQKLQAKLALQAENHA